MKLLDMLLLKNKEIDKNIFSTLYFSYDDISFVGFDKEKICILKKYDSYQILNEVVKEVGEYHHEYKYIVKTNDNKYFFRMLSDDRDLIYDILIYSVKDDSIEKIFFKEEDKLPLELEGINDPIVKVDLNVNLVSNFNKFTSYLGYEDWDYKNKCLNQLDFSSLDSDFIESFNKKDFIKTFNFIKNSGDTVTLKMKFKYIKDYYVIEEITKM